MTLVRTVGVKWGRESRERRVGGGGKLGVEREAGREERGGNRRRGRTEIQGRGVM